MKKKIEIDIKYSVESDNLYVALCDERSHYGSMEYQDNVILFKNREKGNIIGFEILNFKNFNEKAIQFDETTKIVFKKQFDSLKSLIYAFESKSKFPEVLESINKESKDNIIENPSKFFPEKSIPITASITLR